VSAGFLIDSESQIRMGGSTEHENMNMQVRKNDMEIKDNDAMKDLKQKNNNSEDTRNMTDVKNTMDSKNVEHTMINIPSAQCDICESNIAKALKRVTGIEDFKIDIEGKVIHINYNKNATTISKIEKAITSAGYDANNRAADPVAYSKLDNCCKKPEDRGKKN
jgi:copper chaperone CopZ